MFEKVKKWYATKEEKNLGYKELYGALSAYNELNQYYKNKAANKKTVKPFTQQDFFELLVLLKYWRIIFRESQLEKTQGPVAWSKAILKEFMERTITTHPSSSPYKVLLNYLSHDVEEFPRTIKDPLMNEMQYLKRNDINKAKEILKNYSKQRLQAAMKKFEQKESGSYNKLVREIRYSNLPENNNTWKSAKNIATARLNNIHTNTNTNTNTPLTNAQKSAQKSAQEEIDRFNGKIITPPKWWKVWKGGKKNSKKSKCRNNKSHRNSKSRKH